MESNEPTEASSWLVYLVLTAKGRYYTGVTTDIERRCRQHNGELKGGAKALRSQRPVELVWTQALKNRSEAQRWECAIKRLAKLQKQALSLGCEKLLNQLKDRCL